MNDVNRLLKWIGVRLWALIFPQGNQCHACHQPMLSAQEGWLCAECRDAMEDTRISAEVQPFHLDSLMPRTYAVFLYEGPARRLIHRLKYEADHFSALPLAEAMAALYANAEGLREAELLIPVPLHPKRQKQRGYNQALLLAEGMGRHTGIAVLDGAFHRIRNTARQVGGTKGQRARNMHHAFEVVEDRKIKGKRLILVDDVCTTGTTAVACAQALMSAGAQEVLLLTVCKA